MTARDPGSTVLADRFDEILAEYRRPDPQPVPPPLLDRITVLPPERLLEDDLLDLLAGAEDSGEGLRARIAEHVAARLGPDFASARAAVSD